MYVLLLPTLSIDLSHNQGADAKYVLTSQGMQHQAIFGDLNTMAHGIARFSPKFCTDKMRFWSLGQSEAVFWDYNVFQVMDPLTSPTQLGAVEAGEQTQSGQAAIKRLHNTSYAISVMSCSTSTQHV